MNRTIKSFACVILMLIANSSLASTKDVEQFINTVAQNVIKTVTNKATSEQQKKAEIKSIIATNFDTDWMSNFVLGRNYKALSAEQQQTYKKLYLNYLVGNYFPILMKYDNDKFTINQINKASNTNYNVDTTIQRLNKPSVSIKYYIKETDSSLKALDMIVEGISTIISQRSEFDSIIQQDGLDGFMQKMIKKYS
ncbi:MAG: ABC transporter substrate-binding protein [Rickettsiales bacterium]|nr:ABC transporter substrate-binding protein [Rickettsiales bacterium]